MNLSHISILEFGDSSTLRAGYLFAAMGAVVLRMDAGEESATADAATLQHENAGKLLISCPGPDRLNNVNLLAAHCDAIVLGGSTTAFATELQVRHPHLLIACITPWGLTGPKALWKGGDLTALASGGLMWLTGLPDREPVRVPEDQAYQLGSTYAAIGVLLALQARRRSGEGQIIDVSLQETVATLFGESGVTIAQTRGETPGRTGNSHPIITPADLYRCTDGLVSIVVGERRKWYAFRQWVHEHTGDDRILAAELEHPLERNKHRKLVDELVAAFTRERSQEWLFTEGQARGFAIAPCSTMAGVCKDRHVDSRDMLVSAEESMDLAPPFRINGQRVRDETRPASRLGSELQTVIEHDLIGVRL